MQWQQVMKLTRVHESVFALPWVLATALLPYCSEIYPHEGSALRWLWIVVAFITARTAAMSFNRLIDRQIDADNPRTRHRMLPSGEANPAQVAAVAWGSVAAFLFACYQINMLCLQLAPIAVFLLWAYSYTKRFTSLCHFVLGAVQFFGPVMAWAAITGSINLPPLLIGAAIALSIAANDIVYHLMDWTFDRDYGLYSIPVRLGPRRSLFLARACHALAVVLLWEAGVHAQLPLIYFSGVLAVAVIYLYHHRLIQNDEDGDIPTVFLRCNSWVGITLLTFTIGAFLCHVLS